MIAGVLALVLAAADTTSRFPLLQADTMPVIEVPIAVAVDSAPRAEVPVAAPAFRATLPAIEWTLRTDADTVPRKKKKLVEYSDWYGRRLAIHRTLSWAMLPLFGLSYYTGTRLAEDGRQNSPYWVRALHPWAATGDVIVFGTNTVTGLWNLWDARHDPEGRTRRWIHSALFMAANAGFAYAGSLGEDARNNGKIRARHRDIASISMGVSTVSWLIMLIGK